MIQKFTVLSGLVLSATCMVLHQPSLPLIVGQYDNPNYHFAYEVNDAHTGDIKSQHESRRGDAVLGQYSLVQPDGIQRTVDYRADDHSGFQATVNNNGRALAALDATRPSFAAQSYQQWPASTALPATAAYPSTAYSSSAHTSSGYPSNSYPSSSYSSSAYSSSAHPSSAYPSNSYPSSAYPSPAPTAGTSGAVSRTSFVQTFAQSPVSHNPWP